MADRDYTELYASLQKETTILTAQIRALYRELDKKISSSRSADSNYIWI